MLALPQAAGGVIGVSRPAELNSISILRCSVSKHPIDPMWIWSGKVPCVDGLRAFAILCVVLSHLGRDDLPRGWEIGHFGVTAFFVISGFLITLMLLRERRKTGRISLAGFYKRRAPRILPAYTVFLAAMGFLQLGGVFHYPASNWLAAITYTSCLWRVSSVGHNLGHSWSLSVEEHFYLLWPLALVYLSPRRAFFILLAYIAATPALRWAMGSGYIPGMDLNYASPTQMSSIAIGCILALVIAAGVAPRTMTFLSERTNWLLLLAAVLLILSRTISPLLRVPFSDPIKSSMFGLILAWILLTKRPGWLQRFLMTPLMVWIGILSYSIYLWQQPLTEGARIPGGTVARVAALGIAAAISYWVVERPFLRLKKSMAS